VPQTDNFGFLDSAQKTSTQEQGGLSFLDSKPAQEQTFDKPSTPTQTIPENGNLGISGLDKSAPASTSAGDFGFLDKPSDQSLNELEPQKVVQTNKEAVDANAPWYKKAWNAVNEPLFDETTAKNWFGADVHSWGGLGQGFFSLLSGLTSPLQLALTIGTFGSGALLDAGGVAALKAAGWAAKDIDAVVEGSGLASKLIHAGHDSDLVWQGLASKGFDVQKISEGLDVIKNAGLTPESLTSTGVIRRAGSSVLRQIGVDTAMAENVATWTQSAIDAGFTVQNAYAAAIISPRVFDAIKEGDYETAKKLAVEAAGTGLFAGLGAHQAYTHAGELMPDAAAKLGLRVKPSDENIKLIKEFEKHDRDNIITSETHKQWEKDMRSRHKELSDDDMQRARFYYESGSDKNSLARWHDAVAESAGRDERKYVEKERPKLEMSVHPDAKGDYLFRFTHNGEDAGEFALTSAYDVKPGHMEASWINVPEDMRQKGIGTEMHRQAIDFLKSKGKTGLVTDVLTFPEANKIWDSLSREYKVTKDTALGDRRKIDFSDKKIEDSFREAIDKQELKNKPKAYVDKLLNQLDPDKLEDKHVDFAKEVSDHFNKTLEQAREAGVLTEGANNYITRIFKNPENDTVRKFRPASQSSSFSTYTPFSRKRVFDTTLEGILNGHELADFDPIALAAHNGNEFGRIINARNTLENLRSKSVRASDGRPMVALSGTGHAMIDEDGNRIGTAVQPGRAQSLRIADKVVEGLKNNIIKVAEYSPEEKIKIPFTGEIDKFNNPDHIKLFEDWKNSKDPLWKSGYSSDNYIRERLATEEVKPGKLIKSEVTELDKLFKEGRIVKFGEDSKTGKQLYAWTTYDYRDVNNSSFKGWASRVQDSEGNPIYIESDLKAHPEAHEYLNRRFGNQESLVSKVPGVKSLLKAGQEAKGILLFGSPFHIIQEGLRAVMTGISPFGHTEFDANNPMHRLAASKGVWEGKEYKGATAFQEGLAGHSKLISKIPGLAQIQDWQQRFLFDRYIPSLKLRAFENLYNRYQKAYPDWAADKAANVAAADTANRFGGIPYKRMGRAAGTMDATRLIALAPDWLESEIRFMGSLFGEGGKITRRDTAKMALALWGAARVLNALVDNGNMHNEAPFGVAHKDEDGRTKIYSVRTMPTDMLHAVSDPAGFVRGRVAPLVRTGIQTYTGRDEFGRKLPENGLWINALKNIAPIGLQSAAKKITGEDPGITGVDSAIKAVGGTVFPYRTEAQKLAAKIAADHSEQGAVDQDKLRRHQAVLRLEDQIRNGQAPVSTLHQLIDEGQLHSNEARTIEKNVKETTGMDPDLARLYSHASRAPMSDMIKIWEASTNHEKALLAPLLLKKKQAYIKKAIKDMSPQERTSDSTYQWIRSMFPQDSPFGGSNINNIIPGGTNSTPNKTKPSLYGSQKSTSSDDEPPPPVIGGKTIDSIDKAFDLFKGRKLNADELAKAAPIFEKLLDLGQVKIHELPQQLIDYLSEGKGNYAFQNEERKNDIAITSNKKYLSTAPISKEAIVGHEITHVYQSQGGESSMQFANKFGEDRYGIPNAKNMTALYNNGIKFKDFTPEQQGSIVGTYIHLINSLDGKDKSKDEDKKSYIHALQPYIDDLRLSQSYKPSMQLESAVKDAKDVIEDVRRGVFKKLGIF
jgi:RimJ/RimL family protein N-acetyltransferase